MRTATLAAIAILTFPAFAASAAPEASPSQGTIMPDTPSGAGEPDAVACRAPQKLADIGALGPQVCMHNRFWAMLTNTGKDLAPDGQTVVMRTMTDEPTGAGHPDAVTCRKPQAITANRTWHGPEICLTNATWAGLIARQLRITGDGRVISVRMAGPATGTDNFPMVDAGPPIGGSYGPMAGR